MDDERVSGRTVFCCEDSFNCFWVFDIAGKAVDRFSWDGDKASIA